MITYGASSFKMTLLTFAITAGESNLYPSTIKLKGDKQTVGAVVGRIIPYHTHSCDVPF